jgi:superfamily I DNA and/or RNA helicase
LLPIVDLWPQIVMVEEAGEVFEAHVLAALSRATEHLILVGDHEQLRPKPNRYELQAISGRRLDLDVSLFERLACTPTFPRATLAIQRRMRPDISR